jgi:5,5'-dehydrodivanillate O-demethylase
LFVYMGPDPAQAPLLPNWDVLARTDRPKKIRMMPRHTCNWLQITENTADSVHTYFLHGHMSKLLDLPTLATGAFFYRPIESYDWSVSEWGVEKTIVYGGDRPEVEIRPPLVFPNILRIPEGPVEALHFRIPVDDEHTDIIWIGLMPAGSGELTDGRSIPYEIEIDPPGVTVETVSLDTFYGQDRVVWETQGVIADRSNEVLGASDRGIVMYRRMLSEQIDRVVEGKDPTVAVVRDPAHNVCIEFQNQTRPWTADDRAAAVS